MGDLYLREGKVGDAVDMYERAVTHYAEQGFPNNAIALCNKILRNAPGRTPIYLKLAQLMLDRGFQGEAKQNLLEYAERMQKAGKTDEAFKALKEFADLSPDNEEIRLLLAEQLRAADRDGEAKEQLAKLYHEAKSSGDERRSRTTLTNIKAIDPDFEPGAAPKPKAAAKSQKSSDLVFLDLDEEYDTDGQAAVAEAKAPPAPKPAPKPTTKPAPTPEPVERPADALEVDRGFEGVDVSEVEVSSLDIEATSLEMEPTALEVEPPALEFETTSMADDAPAELAIEPEEEVVGGDLVLETFEPTEPDVPEEPADGLVIAAPVLEAEDEPLELESMDVELPTIEFEAEAGVALDEGDDVTFDVPDLDLGGEVSAETEPSRISTDLSVIEDAAPPTVAELEAAVADGPDDPGAHVSLGEALVEDGQRERGVRELDIALGLYEQVEDWSHARDLVGEILRLDPNSVQHHQKRVELAFRGGDKGRLVEAYLGLADALFRSGATDRARAVYQRVLEHDGSNAHAREAIASLEPEPEAPRAPAAAVAPASGGGGFVDLGAMILDDEPELNTRMRVDDEEPTGDEERDFSDMLAQFKRGIEANIGEDDWQAHYDLGVAFKEMGLVDEAIAEFQKSLRSALGRMQTAEALGSCFFEKGQYSVAATVMRRAVESDPTTGDEKKIGLLYWIGRCEEVQNRGTEALQYYQRVFAIDITFQDVSDRVQALAG